MRYLKPYGKFTDVHYKLFESVYDTDMDSYTNLAKEICYELEDDGYDVEVKSELVIPSWAKDEIKKGHIVLHRERVLDVTISKKGWFDYNNIKDTCDRLIDVMGDSIHWSSSKEPRKAMILDDDSVKTYYYLRCDRSHGGKLIYMPYYGCSMWVKIKNSELESEDDKSKCLQTKVVLKFR